MRQNHVRSTLAAVGLAALTFAATPAPAETLAPGTLKLGYDIYVGGLYLGRMTLNTRIDGDTYHLAVGAEANDLISAFVSWSYTAEAEGRFVGDTGVQPSRFASDRSLRDRRWTARLDYDARGNVTPSDDPPMSAEKRAEVPEDMRDGTMDLLSASAAIARAVDAAGGRCKARVPVYDGRRRYDVVAEPKKDRTIQRSRYSAYEGTGIGCAISIDPKAGFRKAKRRNDDFWTIPRDGERRGFTLYLGRPAPGDPLVPVRLEADELFYAEIIGHLADIERVEQRAEVP